MNVSHFQPCPCHLASWQSHFARNPWINQYRANGFVSHLKKEKKRSDNRAQIGWCVFFYFCVLFFFLSSYQLSVPILVPQLEFIVTVRENEKRKQTNTKCCVVFFTAIFNVYNTNTQNATYTLYFLQLNLVFSGTDFPTTISIRNSQRCNIVIVQYFVSQAVIFGSCHSTRCCLLSVCICITLRLEVLWWTVSTTPLRHLHWTFFRRFCICFDFDEWTNAMQMQRVKVKANANWISNFFSKLFFSARISNFSFN